MEPKKDCKHNYLRSRKNKKEKKFDDTILYICDDCGDLHIKSKHNEEVPISPFLQSLSSVFSHVTKQMQTDLAKVMGQQTIEQSKFNTALADSMKALDKAMK